MIKEITGFINHLPPELKALSTKYKDGLHIMLRIQSNGAVEAVQSVFTRKKNLTNDEEEFLNHCKMLTQLSWMIDTNKCIDTITRAIHSCNPYCLAIKRDNLIGGKNYKKRKAEKKNLVYGSLEYYFTSVANFTETEEELVIANIFANALNNEVKLHKWLLGIDGYNQLKDNEYLIFYLDLEPDIYEKAYKHYFTDERLFNTGIPITIENQKFGLSGFLNGFNPDKPFLIHQTATFDTAGRISTNDARSLHEFKEVINSNVFPRPLPVFIYEDELKDEIAVIKKNADEGKKMTYQVIIETLYEKHKDELGNYYLLYYQGEIKDFDFVSKFEFKLKDSKNNKDFWQVKNVMKLLDKDGNSLKSYPILKNIFDLFYGLWIPVLGDKYSKFENFFEELKEDNYRFTDGKVELKYTLTYLAIRKYRKAIYDFVYKSRRQLIQSSQFKEIMLAGIFDDLKYAKDYRLKEKLNIYFSLNHLFDPTNSNFDGFYMPDKLDLLIAKTMKIADTPERVAVNDVYEFAFISGQMIDFLLAQSMSADKTHLALEGFLQKFDVGLFKEEIAKLFAKYKHEIERKESLTKKGRVANLMREIMAFDQPADMRKLLTFLLAGYFSPSFFYTRSQQ